MGNKNQYGLDRDIPLPIKRGIRKRCYFGCVVCGCPIIQYHHFEPEFNDATKHLPEGITLLCPTCHQKTLGGSFSLDLIKQKNSQPFNKKHPILRDKFFLNYSKDKPIKFKLGIITFNSLNILKYNDVPLIYFNLKDDVNEPFVLNAIIYDELEQQVLRIENNEWMTDTTDVFDIEFISSRFLTIKQRAGKINLKIAFTSPDEISIIQWRMVYKGYKIDVQNDKIKILAPNWPPDGWATFTGKLTIVGGSLSFGPDNKISFTKDFRLYQTPTPWG